LYASPFVIFAIPLSEVYWSSIFINPGEVAKCFLPIDG
jgi:hypothetical protein